MNIIDFSPVTANLVHTRGFTLNQCIDLMRIEEFVQLGEYLIPLGNP